jgi:hypothetical protein
VATGFGKHTWKTSDVKRWWAHWFMMVVIGAGVAVGAGGGALGQTNTAAGGAGQAAEEKEACTRNLKVIYEAIQAFQGDHHDLPNWLSDLVPQYLPDANVLVCPVCRRTGQIEAPPLADPKLPCSYLFEFCPVPLGGLGTNGPVHTRKEWKRRQMGLVGSDVPIVRCRHHAPVLNLAFDGRIYESPAVWELAFTNRVRAAELTPARIFAAPATRAGNAGKKPAGKARVAARDPAARKQLLDLTEFYNARLDEAWHGNRGNDLIELPSGLQTFNGVEFDVRGIVQLCSQSGASAKYPVMVKGIPVQQKCQRLHFLHAAGFGTVADEGKQIGMYVVHYATNQMRLEIPIRYGHEVRNWHVLGKEPAAPADLVVAWTGQNALTRVGGREIRLFLTTWTNTTPDIEIKSLDYVSSMSLPAPFLVAITVGE